MVVLHYPSISLAANELICVQAHRPLFKPLSFSLSNSQILLLQGINGIGKTTCLRTLAGLLTPERGSLLWQEQPLKPYLNDYLQNMVYIGHHPGIKAALSPTENIRQSVLLAGHAIEDKSISEALAQVELSHVADTPCGQLSSGQQRRVNIARLSLMQVPLWILDEPLTALDKQGTKIVEEKLLAHKEKGGSVILTSHQHLSVATDEMVLEAWS